MFLVPIFAAVSTLLNSTLDTAPEKALQALIEGNGRFVSQSSIQKPADAERLKLLAKGQHPIAAIVACADSRVAPELVFDQGLGDLFVVRTAGNTVDKAGLGSLEYAIEHLGVKLILVVGHEKCGAVKAAIDGGHLPGSLPSVVAPILPAVKSAKKLSGDLVHNSVRLNALRVAHQLRKADPLIAEEVKSKKVKISAATYDLETGKVTVIE